jgi:hypothetical protein
MKHITEMLQLGLNWKCGVKHFVAIDNNIDLKMCVMIAMRVTIPSEANQESTLVLTKNYFGLVFCGGQL